MKPIKLKSLLLEQAAPKPNPDNFYIVSKLGKGLYGRLTPKEIFTVEENDNPEYKGKVCIKMADPNYDYHDYLDPDYFWEIFVKYDKIFILLVLALKQLNIPAKINNPKNAVKKDSLL